MMGLRVEEVYEGGGGEVGKEGRWRRGCGGEVRTG